MQFDAQSIGNDVCNNHLGCAQIRVFHIVCNWIMHEKL